jgi:hypothetical protein
MAFLKIYGHNETEPARKNVFSSYQQMAEATGNVRMVAAGPTCEL